MLFGGWLLSSSFLIDAEIDFVRVLLLTKCALCRARASLIVFYVAIRDLTTVNNTA